MRVIPTCFLYLCLVVITVSCSQNSRDETATPAYIPVTKSRVEITATTKYQDNTKITPQITATSDEIPTLSTDQARTKVIDLLNDNEECQLPCFWGMTPGKTKWSEVKESLRSFSSQYSEDPVDTEFFYSNLYFPSSDDQAPTDINLELGINQDVIRTIALSDFDASSYSLNQFLSRNGKPDEIWIYTNSRGTISSKVGFLVSLFYREKQMIVAYGKGSGTIENEWINGCIEFSPSLRIWSLDKSIGFPDAAQFFYNSNVIQDGWKQISDATRGELGVEEFYQLFVDPNRKPCFKTPRSLWPAQ